jgi:aspartate aminotransferase-like enzyme
MMLVPGPVELHPRVLKAMSEQVISHRSERFSALLSEITEGLNWAADGGEGSRVALLTGSGTLAVESMIYSIINPGDKVLSLEFGEFGRRMRESLEIRGAVVHTIKAAPGKTPTLDEIERTAEDFKPKYIATVHVETSTGAIMKNLEGISKIAESIGSHVLLDAVSSFGGEELRMEKWGIYAVASCSQKGLGAPPGLSFVILSRDAVKRTCETEKKPSYLDLCKSMKFLERRETPFTPAVNLMYGLAEALKLLREEGKERRWERIRRASELLYRKAESLGYTPLPPEESRAHTIVALYPPRGLDAAKVIEELRKRGIYVAAGMGELKGKILRIGIMGYVEEHHIEKLVGELESIGRGAP